VALPIRGVLGSTALGTFELAAWAPWTTTVPPTTHVRSGVTADIASSALSAIVARSAVSALGARSAVSATVARSAVSATSVKSEVT